MELFQDNWSPGTRMLTGATASALALYALRHGGVCGLAAFVCGAALFARTTANRPLRDIAHLGTHPDAAAEPIESQLKVRQAKP